MNQPIIIPLSKGKLFFGISSSIFFVIMGISILADVDSTSENPMLLRIAGTACVLFFGALGIYGTKKIFDKKPGVMIDEQGITDYSNATSIGLIKWSDITAIRTHKIMATKFLMIDIRNPEAYLEKSNSSMQRKLMQANMKTYGTPISITSNTLNYDFEKLEKLVQEKFSKYNKIT